MSSAALQSWETLRAAELDEIERAHRAVGGTGRGRRYATLQVNHAYTVLLSSQFQGFCRDLHDECVAFLVANVAPAAFRPALQADLVLHRQLDRFNPTPGSLGADFSRLGLPFWDRVRGHDSRTPRRMEMLTELNEWRNAIAHHDFTSVGGSTILQLATVRAWRSACVGLARSFDAVLKSHSHDVVGLDSW